MRSGIRMQWVKVLLASTVSQIRVLIQVMATVFWSNSMQMYFERQQKMNQAFLVLPLIWEMRTRVPGSWVVLAWFWWLWLCGTKTIDGRSHILSLLLPLNLFLFVIPKNIPINKWGNNFIDYICSDTYYVTHITHSMCDKVLRYVAPEIHKKCWEMLPWALC